MQIIDTIQLPLNYPPFGASFMKTHYLHFSQVDQESYYRLSYNHQEVATLHYRLYKDATKAIDLENPPWARMLGKANMSVESPRNSLQKNSPDDLVSKDEKPCQPSLLPLRGCKASDGKI